MRRFIVIALLLALPLVGYTADTEATTVPVFDLLEKYVAVYHVTADDSGALSVVDTTWACPVFPNGYDVPMPDNIVLRGSFVEIGANTSADSVIVNIDTAPTNAAKASADWVIISQTAGDATYANRTGNADTIDCAAASTASRYFNYAFTADQKSALLPYFRIRWGNSAGFSGDSVDVDWYVIYTWDNDPN